MTKKKVKAVIPSTNEIVKEDVNSKVTNVINERTITNKHG